MCAKTLKTSNCWGGIDDGEEEEEDDG